MSTAVYDIPVKKINGEASTLGEYAGQVTLVVNVASKCGLTPQYEALEKIYRDYRDKGFVIAGFPANDFAGQEPGTNEEIQTFCQTMFSVDFPLYEKIVVTGADTHPLYQALILAQPEAISTAEKPFREDLEGYGIKTNDAPGILWNFEKFLLNRQGDVVARFSPEMVPDDPIVVEAIEKEIAK
ncbi:glutathione peroxidase [Silvibacterium acidisoli]|uniref:glutathione peroxidase n=1 Tax=Acidobacteriaceae bacterium ZG23-2 TaxID=2883246 RepID=UPI00406C6D4C